MTQPIVTELIDLLQLERLEVNLFRGASRDIGTKYVFGGQVLGQALSAAQQTVPDERHVHFAPAKMALENGFHVICDKPVTFNLKEALALEKIVAKTGLVFALTHNYTGYPMV